MIHPAHLDASVFVLGLVLLGIEAFLERTDRRVLAFGGVAGLTAILALSFAVGAPDGGPVVGRLYVADPTALFFKRFFLVTTAVVLLMALEYKPTLARAIPSRHPESGLGEFYALPVLVCAGLMWLVSAGDLLFAFVALELVTVGFCVLIAYMRRDIASLEAGTKYLVLGSLAGALFLYGIAWMFGVTGETNLAAMGNALSKLDPGDDGPLLFALALLLAGLAFKIGAAPFQMWVPDVYQGAPTPVTALLAVGSKAAGFVLLMRVIEPALRHPVAAVRIPPVLAILAALSLLLGNLAAIPQYNLKRMLAYSSIGHVGYMLMAAAAVRVAAPVGPAIAFYLVAYLLMTLLAFFVLVVVANTAGRDEIADFRGLGRRAPGLAALLLLALISLAGIPFTAGFAGKLLVFAAALRAHLYLLAAIGAVTVGAGFCFYLNVVRAMYWQEPADRSPIRTSRSAGVAMCALAIGIFLYGVYPTPLLRWGRSASSPASVETGAAEPPRPDAGSAAVETGL